MLVIKQPIKYLLLPLLHVINSLLITTTFSDKIKLSIINSYYKVVTQRNFQINAQQNCCHLFSKIYEIVIHIQLSTFIEDNLVLLKQQCGFREGKAVMDTGIYLCESIINCIDKKEQVVGIFMDLTNTFDILLSCTVIQSLS